MKKILFTLFIGMTFISCSSSDDDSIVQQNITIQYFHVPQEYVGTWRITGTSTSYFSFKKDDFILVTPDASYKTVLEQAASTLQTAKVD